MIQDATGKGWGWSILLVTFIGVGASSVATYWVREVIEQLDIWLPELGKSTDERLDRLSEEISGVRKPKDPRDYC